MIIFSVSQSNYYTRVESKKNLNAINREIRGGRGRKDSCVKNSASNGSEASYRRYSNKKISTTFTLAGVLAASWQISYFLRRDCILRKREGRFSTSLFAALPSSSYIATLYTVMYFGARTTGQTCA